MVKEKIASIELDFFSHGTEDPEKVMNAAKTILSVGSVNSINFHKKHVKGEYGNTIIYFWLKIEDSEKIQGIFMNLRNNLTIIDKQILSQSFKLRLQNKRFYLRFDKQIAFGGRLRISQADAICLRINFRNLNTDEIKKICLDEGLLL